MTLHVLGAEKHRFALEHFDGKEKGDGGVDARGRKNDGDIVPMVRAYH